MKQTLTRPSHSMDLVCPAGNLPALRAAVDNGADWVYFGALRKLAEGQQQTLGAYSRPWK